MARDLKPYIAYTMKQSMKTLILNKVGANSKPLGTIEMPLRVHLQLFVPTFLSIKN